YRGRGARFDREFDAGSGRLPDSDGGAQRLGLDDVGLRAEALIMRRRQCAGLIVGGVMFCVFAPTAWTQTARKPIFISPEQLDMASILASPPANSSPETIAEIAELHRLQEVRSRAQIEYAKADDAEEEIFIFKDAMGERFTRESFPLTAALSDHVRSDEGVIVNP